MGSVWRLLVRRQQGGDVAFLGCSAVGMRGAKSSQAVLFGQLIHLLTIDDLP
jgi:hypothetical protein